MIVKWEIYICRVIVENKSYLDTFNGIHCCSSEFIVLALGWGADKDYSQDFPTYGNLI